MLNEKIKILRKNNNMTQEELADKISVSRQAITKWESGIGTPDITNLEALSKLFNVSIDELLSSNSNIKKENISRTEFDIFSKTDFNLNVGAVNELDVTIMDIEKVIVEVRSDLENSYKLAKVKLTEGKDVELKVVGNKKLKLNQDKSLSKQDARNHLFIKMILPKDLCNEIELEGDLNYLHIHDFDIEKHIEFDGKIKKLDINNVIGYIEINNNTDMEINYDGKLNQLDINQWKCISNLYVNTDDLNIYNKGRFSNIIYNEFENNPDSLHKVELNGFKSELTVRKI